MRDRVLERFGQSGWRKTIFAAVQSTPTEFKRECENPAISCLRIRLPGPSYTRTGENILLMRSTIKTIVADVFTTTRNIPFL